MMNYPGQVILNTQISKLMQEYNAEKKILQNIK